MRNDSTFQQIGYLRKVEALKDGEVIGATRFHACLRTRYENRANSSNSQNYQLAQKRSECAFSFLSKILKKKKAPFPSEEALLSEEEKKSSLQLRNKRNVQNLELVHKM